MDSALYQMSINSKIKYFQQLISHLLTNLYYWIVLRLQKNCCYLSYYNFRNRKTVILQKLRLCYPKLIHFSAVMTISSFSSEKSSQ